MREGWKRKAHSKRMINVELINTKRGLAATARPEGARPNKKHYYSLIPYLISIFLLLANGAKATGYGQKLKSSKNTARPAGFYV
jgi:hypothetical protein